MASPWQEAKSADGKIYYYNVNTKATQWTKPQEMMTSAEKALQDLPWKEHKAQDGRVYWYHVHTRETTWEMPVVYKVGLEKTLCSASGSTQTFVAGGIQFPQNSERALVIPGHILEVGPDGAAKPISLASSFSNESKTELHYSTHDEAESAFVKLLRRNNVGADWTWEKTMRMVIKEPQYRALKDPKDRKAAFENYIVELKQQEQEKAKDRIAKLRQDFSVMLKSHPEIKHYTRWKTARLIIEGETIFRSTSNEEERRQLFDEYTNQLRKSEIERDARTRKEALDELFILLKSLEMEPYTRWAEAQTLIQQNDHFQSEAKFQALTQLDILTAFENHIKYLERDLNDQRQKSKTVKHRKERKNREAFTHLLNELRLKGEIRAGSKWKQVYPLITDDERYQTMLGQSGSTPLDLFWDIIEDMERDVRLKKTLVEDLLGEMHFSINENTSFQEFVDVLKGDSRTAHYDRDTTVILFEKLREKIVRKMEDDRHQQERHQRRRVDALRSVIKHLEPPVEINDSYEKIRPRIQNAEEFRVIDSEDLRRAAFDKHLRRVKDKHEDREKDRDRRDRDKDRQRRQESSRSGYDAYSKPRHSRTDRERSRHLTRTPEPDPYEAERRRAAGERERQYRGRRDSSVQRSDRGSRAHSRQRHDRTESVYDRERREREEERERQYSLSVRDRDEYRPSTRRRRGLTPEEDDRDPKRSRRERTPRVRTPPPRERIFDDTAPVMNYGEDPMIDYGKDLYKDNEGKKEKTKPSPKADKLSNSKERKDDRMEIDRKAEESEEGEIAE